MQAQKSKQIQMGVLCFLAMVCRVVLPPVEQVQRANVQVLIWVILLHGLTTWLLAQPLLRCRMVQSPAFSWALGTLILVNLGVQLLDAEMFCRSISYEPLPASLVILVFGVVAYYAVSHGRATALRVGELIAMVLVVAFVLLVVGSAGNVRLSNLAYEATPWSEIFSLYGKTYVFPVEVFLFCTLLQPEQMPSKKVFTQLMCVLVGITILLSFGVELVLGNAQQSQPLLVLARSGGISVFQRIDMIQVTAWLLCVMGKLILLFSYLRKLLSNHSRWWVVGIVLVGLCVASFVQRSWIHIAYNILAAIVGAILMLQSQKGGTICEQKY